MKPTYFDFTVEDLDKAKGLLEHVFNWRFDEDIGEKTNVRLSQIPFNSTDAEIASFAKMMESMRGGWGKGYAIIDEILAELQTG